MGESAYDDTQLGKILHISGHEGRLHASTADKAKVVRIAGLRGTGTRDAHGIVKAGRESGAKTAGTCATHASNLSCSPAHCFPTTFEADIALSAS